MLSDTDEVYNPFVFFDDGAVYMLHTTDVPMVMTTCRSPSLTRVI